MMMMEDASDHNKVKGQYGPGRGREILWRYARAAERKVRKGDCAFVC